MPIYDKPTKILLREFAKEMLKPGQFFDKKQAVDWFAKHYPDIRPTTVQMHVEAMAVNSPTRRHHSNVHVGSNHDLFFKEAPGKFRLWEPNHDPAPKYGDDFKGSEEAKAEIDEELVSTNESSEGSSEFAYEKDLRNYLEKNLSALEPGLTLYQDEGLSGIEFQAGGRFIDILAIDKNGTFVVVELKVSRGYDRVIGQLMRYMAWIQKNMAEGKPVRGIIVASEITDDLKLACSILPGGVNLVEYELSFKLKPIQIQP